MSFTSGLPPIDRSQLPADVRDAAPARKQAYEAGLGFEQLLVQQLSQSLVDSTDGTSSADGSASDGTDSTDSTNSTGGLGGGSPYASLLPDALTSGVMDVGGLGLARQLMDAIAPAVSATPAPGTPGSSATSPSPTAPVTSSTGSAAGGASMP